MGLVQESSVGYLSIVGVGSRAAAHYSALIAINSSTRSACPTNFAADTQLFVAINYANNIATALVYLLY